MPSAQSVSVSVQRSSNVDNKIAKAVEKVNASSQQVLENQSQNQQSSSGTASAGNKTPQDQPEFIKQSLILIEKKVRNLEKRRSKLDEYKAIQKKGSTLNEDQLQAVERYDEVTRTLELARELEKNFITLASDAMKQQKKQAKKEQLEREELVKDKLKESYRIIALLNTLKNENVRNDFLNEVNGAIKLDQEIFKKLEEFDKLISPQSYRFESPQLESVDHLYSLIEGKSKNIPWNDHSDSNSSLSTYSDLKKLLERITASTYWNRSEKRDEVVLKNDSEVVDTPQPTELEENQDVQVNNLEVNNDQNHTDELNQGSHHQNTSDDYVLVSSNDIPLEQNVEQLNNAQTSKTFFSTLNPTETRDINEFLNQTNNDDALNFLQDSELAVATQLQQQHDQLQQQQQFQTVGGDHAVNQNNQNFSKNNNFRSNRNERDYNRGSQNYPRGGRPQGPRGAGGNNNNFRGNQQGNQPRSNFNQNRGNNYGNTQRNMNNNGGRSNYQQTNPQQYQQQPQQQANA